MVVCIGIHPRRLVVSPRLSNGLDVIDETWLAAKYPHRGLEIERVLNAINQILLALIVLEFFNHRESAIQHQNWQAELE